MDLNVEQETLRELSSRKQNLLLELKNYEANQSASLGTGGLGKASMMADSDVGMIPAQTQLQTALAINLGTEGKAVSWTILALCVFYMFYSLHLLFYLQHILTACPLCIAFSLMSRLSRFFLN